MNPRRPTLLSTWLAATILIAAAATSAAQPVAATPEASPATAAKPPAKPNNGAAAKKPEAEPDTLILSDTLSYDDVKKESVFTGNVIMTRGLMTLRSDKLVVREDAEGFQYGTATVGPNKLVFIRQEDPAKFEVLEAKGVRAEYNGKTEEVEMIGQAVVTRFVCGKQFDHISGERVKFNQATNTYQAYSGPNSASAGGRVRSIAAPRAKSDAAAAECQKKSAKG
ncbi:MAG TPA: lipopolysaccharide transport periplasmic protein LptA [Eoetvoesiella sp.]